MDHFCIRGVQITHCIPVVWFGVVSLVSGVKEKVLWLDVVTEFFFSAVNTINNFVKEPFKLFRRVIVTLYKDNKFLAVLHKFHNALHSLRHGPEDS